VGPALLPPFTPDATLAAADAAAFAPDATLSQIAAAYDKAGAYTRSLLSST